MKRLLITLAVVLGVAGAAQAETLKGAFERIAALEGAKSYGQADTDKVLAELNSSLPLDSYSSVVMEDEKGSAGVSEALARVSAIVSEVDGTAQIVTAANDYNTFVVVNTPAVDGVCDVMAVWQENYYGTTFVVYGTATEEAVGRLSLGEVVLNHYGVSVRPMSKRWYDEYQQLLPMQQEIWKDQADKRPYKKLQRELDRDAARIQRAIERQSRDQ